MRAVSKRNSSSAKYGKFIWPQGKRSWSFTRATKKKERWCADPCCDWDTFGPRWKCSFTLLMAQQCGASSWSYHELSLHCFFLGFPPSYMLSLIFFLLFLILFGCWQFSLTHGLGSIMVVRVKENCQHPNKIKITMTTYCPHKESGEGGLVQIWTPN